MQIRHKFFLHRRVLDSFWSEWDVDTRSTEVLPILLIKVGDSTSSPCGGSIGKSKSYARLSFRAPVRPEAVIIERDDLELAPSYAG
jgi:hypothetical protein